MDGWWTDEWSALWTTERLRLRGVAYEAQGGSVELRPLQAARRDEEAAVGAPHDRQLPRGAVPLALEELGGGVEVVKDVLFCQLRPRLVPLLAVLAAAAEVRHREGACRRTADTVRSDAAFGPPSGAKRWLFWRPGERL